MTVETEQIVESPVQTHIYSLMDTAVVRALVDLGCGCGEELCHLRRRLGPTARIVGMDSRSNTVDAARAAVNGDLNTEIILGSVADGLPFDDDSFDAVYSCNMLECVTDKDRLLQEMHRVLRPGGQVICAHWDWDSQLFDGSDKDLARRIVHTFGDWKQDWMDDCDSWMGRRLWRVFNRSGLFVGKVDAYVVTSTEFTPQSPGYRNAEMFSALVRRDMLSAENYDRFISDLKSLSDGGEFFYCITMFTYVGRKVL